MSAEMAADLNSMAPAGAIMKWLRTHVAPTADLRLDSRAVQAGDVFFACQGGTQAGRSFIADALTRGAAAVVVETESGDIADSTDAEAVPHLTVPGLRAALGTLGDAWYGEPSAAITVIAVTGTNGKTSTAHWVAQSLNHVGKPCGIMGTLGTTLPDGTQLAGELTTPDVLSMHRLLATLRAAGAEAVALEASSIGMVQGRMDGVRVGIAAFTNLTRDHLDYHGDMAAYERAKALLFAWPGLSAAVVNVDDEAGRRLVDTLPAGMVTGFGATPEHAERAAIAAREVQATAQGQVFTLVGPGGEAQIVTPLLGAHNVSNLLLVAGVLTRLGWPLAAIARAIASVEPVDGRLQTVAVPAGAARGPLVVVDYAHTPDALARALIALRPVADARGGRLICVFGCGGDRDPGKRPEMGRVTQRYADGVTVTSDNPRGESPDAIIAQIVAGMVAADVQHRVVADRAVAIMTSVWHAMNEDVVLLAGKGHETYQEAEGRKTPFDDREWARLALLLPAVRGVSTDTRRIGEGELFVALTGPSFDGHDYLSVAQDAGACAAVVATRRSDCTLQQIVLGPTGPALMRMGRAWRERYDLPVITVSGSNGKTTTKEMIAAILASWLGEDNRLATAGNFNNDIGVPLTLLRLTARHRAAVIELGMNHPGEMAALADMAQAQVAVMTNAQREHQEFMHSVEAVARENGEAFAALPADGVAVYPGDDAHAGVWAEIVGERAHITFGLRGDVAVRAEAIHAEDVATRFRLVTPAGSADLRLPVPGAHNLRNALAAAAAGQAAGAPLSAIVQALENFSAVAGRMQKRQMDDGSLLIDDSYNANPDSVRAAIDVLSHLPQPRVLVLGDMGEVGDNGPEMHREVGAYAREQGIDALYTLGSATPASVEAFGQAGRACADVEEILDALRAVQARSVLVKGSRFMRMERVVMGLSDKNNNSAAPRGDTHAA
ncbi:bifunctional UDP-N-acetylmuramoyl-L-alanyl-D-glutamate--2,6-diaminopimelate ligase MurE/UDP-N-acetylmuramoyl-tripeptide--D-alanyl-D-alanine ligase MurF [Alcaligenaceae bacterium C4P045]|nr:bifunctional UDP-N-acetylmuramoyl-L-alanyl-D-glutamate--2,6-diaminopimelate ligase MurE/UDP-N-acetylmuramoyl-tripeptide--D-alanyl-D-alanine ligase MurF [Alcaligenaceae bacterium C4P045]